MKKFSVSNNRNLLDIDMIHLFLSERSYWAKGRSMDTVRISIENSLCFGIYDDGGRQAAFARVVTDYAIFGWLMDVFVLEEYRGIGLGKMLMQAVVGHPDLQKLRRMGLATDDAHGLYSQFGFASLSKQENMMELLRQ